MNDESAPAGCLPPAPPLMPPNVAAVSASTSEVKADERGAADRRLAQQPDGGCPPVRAGAPHPRDGTLCFATTAATSTASRGAAGPRRRSASSGQSFTEWLEHASTGRRRRTTGPAPSRSSRRSTRSRTSSRRCRRSATSTPSVEPPVWLTELQSSCPRARSSRRKRAPRPADRELRAHTPAFFFQHVLPFAYDPNAPTPVRWHRFLDELWDDDDESNDDARRGDSATSSRGAPTSRRCSCSSARSARARARSLVS